MTSPSMRVASAPVSFGIDEIIDDDAWMPGPDEMLDWMVDIGFEGTELGLPGFLGDGPQVCQRLATRGLAFVGSFLPQHFSRAEHAEADRAWLRDHLRLVKEATPAGSRPFAILSDQFDEPDRKAFSGRIAEHPETWLSADRFDTLIDNLHRAAELCHSEGLEPVLHPHAGTYIETADEIARVLDRIDGSLVGLCLDTGHFGYGGADPARAAEDYHELIRHVHIKDVSDAIMAGVRAEGRGLDEALRRGVFCPLGRGDVPIGGVMDALRRHGYTGWLVIEQDQFLSSSDTPASVVAGQRANRAYLRGLGA